jgi:hypothetical protein
MKTKALTITCVMVATLLPGCVKENTEACITCKAKNTEGTVLIEKSICNESEENSFREEYYRYQVTCD